MARGDGRLRGIHRGVYAVGHLAPSIHGEYIAAVFAGGAGAKLSHAPGAHVFKLTRARRPPPPAEITVPTLAHRRRPGIVIHRVAALHPHDVTVHEGIPITSVPRVLLDMAPRLVEGDKVDCHWPQHDLTVELLSYRFHATRDAFEKDVARRRRSQHVAYTWGDVVERPAPTIAELRQLLSRARSSPTRLAPRAYAK